MAAADSITKASANLIAREAERWHLQAGATEHERLRRRVRAREVRPISNDVAMCWTESGCC
eukprot:13834416-Alexandrium_andersonii.AAC.1